MYCKISRKATNSTKIKCNNVNNTARTASQIFVKNRVGLLVPHDHRGKPTCVCRDFERSCEEAEMIDDLKKLQQKY